MYELKKYGKVLTSKSVGTGPSSYEKRIYRAAVSQRFRNTFTPSECLVENHAQPYLDVHTSLSTCHTVYISILILFMIMP